MRPSREEGFCLAEREEEAKHRRNKKGVAECGTPAKQEDLTDDIDEVTCPRCAVTPLFPRGTQ